jgi:hypothetical protein
VSSAMSSLTKILYSYHFYYCLSNTIIVF